MRAFGLLLAAGLALLATASADKCHLREIDLCATSAAGATKVPVNDAEIDKYCKLGDETEECLTGYMNSCATPIQKELVAWATKDPLKSGEEFCKKGTKTRTDFLKHAPCLAKAQPESKKCTEDVRAGLEKLEKAKFQDRIPTACCIYQRYRECSTGVIEGQCGKEAVQHGNVLIEKSAGATLNVMCQGFENNPKCNRLLPPSGTKAAGTSKSIVSRLFSAYVSS